MDKTKLVFKELQNIYGASFHRMNGNIYGDGFYNWAGVVENMTLDQIMTKLEKIRVRHLREVDRCKYIKPVDLVDFQQV